MSKLSTIRIKSGTAEQFMAEFKIKIDSDIGYVFTGCNAITLVYRSGASGWRTETNHVYRDKPNTKFFGDELGLALAYAAQKTGE